ncbi:helix-turn-helix domain-containing protein [Kitasatospora hibisci]|uniref:AraC-like ligand-binding domain-containing protein n=1 Tax=Kitasatospora hibisci TaxID=3369522 RepID=UPI003754CA29
MWLSASAADAAVADRFEWFNDIVASSLIPVGLRSDHAGAFEADVSVLDLGAVQVSRFSHVSLDSKRTAAHIRQGDPEQYQLALVTGNPMWISQQGNDSGLIAGDLVLWNSSRPQVAGCGGEGGRSNSVILHLPRTALPLRAEQMDRLLATRICAQTGLGAILAGFLTTLTTHGADCRPEDLARMGRIALDLTAACLADQLGTPGDLPAETRARAMRERIDTFIDDNLTDPGLTPHAIAAHHGLSLRTLYELFRDRDESVAATVRRRRLERCRTDLARPELRGHPVQAIAARWGFASASGFSRTFREVYGITPTEYRDHALHGLPDGPSCLGARNTKESRTLRIPRQAKRS